MAESVPLPSRVQRVSQLTMQAVCSMGNRHRDSPRLSLPNGRDYGDRCRAIPERVSASLTYNPTTARLPARMNPWGSFERNVSTCARNTVSPDSFQLAATQEGANGRVVTRGELEQTVKSSMPSYGWSRDGRELLRGADPDRDLQHTPVGLPNSLLADGYIITATGGTDGRRAYCLWGTRVQGDTMARPILVVNVATGGGLVFAISTGITRSWDGSSS